MEFRVNFDFDSLLPSTARVADFQISLKGVIITNGMTFLGSEQALLRADASANLQRRGLNQSGGNS